MSDCWDDSDLTRDAFLGGRLTILQPRHGYRAGVDPVLLAASVQIEPGQSLLDLGCGAGVAMLCCAARVPGIGVTGLEVQPGYAELARLNAMANGIDAQIVSGDLGDMPDTLRQQQFDHVIANPPFFDRQTSTTASEPGRETAMGEQTALATWVKEAAKRAAPKGTVTFIHRAERLPELITEMHKHLGSLHLLPLIPRRGKPARLALIRGRKGGRAAFQLHDGHLLHEGAKHERDGENYTSATASILRNGESLRFPD